MSDSLAEDYAERLREYARQAALIPHADRDPVHEVYTDSDAERAPLRVSDLAALLADRDLLARQVEAVKALHRPCSPVFSLHGGLALQEPCPDCRGKAGTHPCGCWSPTDVEYECRECISAPTSKGRPVVPYPCPTIRALEGES